MKYAIDVDGVLFDSRNQLIIDGTNAYNKITGRRAFFSEDITMDNYSRLIKENPSLVRKFDSLHPFSKSAEEMVFIFYAIDNDISIGSDEDFQRELGKIPQARKKCGRMFCMMRGIGSRKSIRTGMQFSGHLIQ